MSQNNPSQSTPNLSNVALPKWPQMLVWGQPVTREQARDIIYRTDDFFWEFSAYGGGNNHEWNKWARETLGIQAVLDQADTQPEAARWRYTCDIESEVRELGQFVSTSYVRNSWASCAFIFGPHGWVHPDGKIGYVDNVGKWPSADEIFEDWQVLATAFPYLDLTVTLMSGESCEDDAEPVVSFRVKDGKVLVLEVPVLPDSQAHANMPSRRTESLMARFAVGSHFEQGLNDAWIVDRGPQMQAWILEASRRIAQRKLEAQQEAA